jgi:hypothetical protein
LSGCSELRVLQHLQPAEPNFRNFFSAEFFFYSQLSLLCD